MLNQANNDRIIEAVNFASESWKSAFNSGDFAKCAEQYQDDAIMNVTPFGQYVGKEDIKFFWKKLIEDGFSKVEYINPSIRVIDKTSAILTSGWKMNKAAGVITKELWILQSDGTAKLKEDDFAVNT